MARPKFYRRVWFVIPASLIAGVVLAEGLLRVLLFNDSPWARRIGADLRDAGNFADSNSDDDYWKLRLLFKPPEQREPCTGFDPVLGWTNAFITPVTYENARSCPPDDRRLVLLYGDSYAACVGREASCFPVILERSRLADRYCMLNYGVGGYGLDQIYLMIQGSIDRWADRKPFVIIGLLVENAFERTVLSFREWPKPRFSLEDGALRLGEPLHDGFDRFLEEHPLEIQSYLARYLAHRSRLLPEWLREEWKGDGSKTEEKQAIARQLFVEIERELTSRGIEHAYVLFHTRGAMTPSSSWPWQETLAREMCAQLGARLISTRAYLWAANGGAPKEPSRFYQHTSGSVGHLNSLGNAIVFEALCDAIEGRADAPVTPEVVAELARRGFPEVRRHEQKQRVFERPALVSTDGERIAARAAPAQIAPFDRWEKARRECIASGIVGPTHVSIELDGSVRQLTASVRAAIYPVLEDATGTVLLRIEGDGRDLYREEIDVLGGARSLDVDLSGVRRLLIECAPLPTTPAETWVCFSDPRME